MLVHDIEVVGGSLADHPGLLYRRSLSVIVIRDALLTMVRLWCTLGVNTASIAFVALGSHIACLVDQLWLITHVCRLLRLVLQAILVPANLVARVS